MSQSDLYPTILASDRLLLDLLEDSFAPEPGAEPVKLADYVLTRYLEEQAACANWSPGA